MTRCDPHGIEIPCSSSAPGAPDAAVLASDLDRRWFRANPDRHHRIRHAIAGELPDARASDCVVIRQVRGCRVRLAFHYDIPLPAGEAPEYIAAGMFERVVDDIVRRRQELGLGPPDLLWYEGGLQALVV